MKKIIYILAGDLRLFFMAFFIFSLYQFKNYTKGDVKIVNISQETIYETVLLYHVQGTILKDSIGTLAPHQKYKGILYDKSEGSLYIQFKDQDQKEQESIIIGYFTHHPSSIFLSIEKDENNSFVFHTRENFWDYSYFNWMN